MRYLCAPDSFKESLTAAEAARALAEGIRRGDSDAEIRCLPMADGGEGTARALADATGGTMLTAGAHDPLGRPVQAGLALLGDGRTAVVETAAASGLALLRPSERDPKATTSYGTGELIRAALDAGAETIIVGLGGSATNDAGCGLLQALGVRLLDHDGRDVRPGGAALAEVERVDLSGLDRRLGDVHVIAACDVTNPLTGPEGASAVFGPQKGASREDVTLLDGALRHVSSVIERALAEQVPAERNGDGGKVEAAVAESSSPGHRSRPDHRTRTPIADHPGAGAAGGIGMALLAVLHADFRPGIDLVIEQSGLDAAAQWADIVFTGEGSIDAQTMFGKTPVGVASVAKRHGKPVIAIAGRVGDGIECLHGRGIDAVFGAAPSAASLDELLRDARANVARTAEQVTRLMRIVRSH